MKWLMDYEEGTRMMRRTQMKYLHIFCFRRKNHAECLDAKETLEALCFHLYSFSNEMFVMRISFGFILAKCAERNENSGKKLISFSVVSITR